MIGKACEPGNRFASFFRRKLSLKERGVPNATVDKYHSLFKIIGDVYKDISGTNPIRAVERYRKHFPLQDPTRPVPSIFWLLKTWRFLTLKFAPPRVSCAVPFPSVELEKIVADPHRVRPIRVANVLVELEDWFEVRSRRRRDPEGLKIHVSADHDISVSILLEEHDPIRAVGPWSLTYGLAAAHAEHGLSCRLDLGFNPIDVFRPEPALGADAGTNHAEIVVDALLRVGVILLQADGIRPRRRAEIGDRHLRMSRPRYPTAVSSHILDDT